MILKMLTVGPFMSNCYVVGSETTREGMVIDPGAEPNTILNTAREMGLEIKLIVATHSHIDHVGAVKQIREKTGAPFAMHEAERQSKAVEGFTRILGGMMGQSFGKPPAPDRLLKEGDIIEIGDLQFKVLYIPGHSPGSIALVGHGVVFSGDTLFQFSIGRTDFPGGSHAQLMNGIFTKLMVLPDETIVYSGHGPETTIGTERKVNPFVQDWAARNA
ncbi:MAG: MBL fold metallo-hydrolase [Chloroflexi bacterium CG07_land_8_20_14_0_80_51_10]|nr:MAG: MBL fold metallo-hydrolase [Chloroflexi bacterium CG07_land_8_20_14_0_80_51_10]